MVGLQAILISNIFIFQNKTLTAIKKKNVDLKNRTKFCMILKNCNNGYNYRIPNSRLFNCCTQYLINKNYNLKKWLILNQNKLYVEIFV